MSENESKPDKEISGQKESTQSEPAAGDQPDKQEVSQSVKVDPKKADFIAWLKANAKVPKTLLDFDAVRGMAAKSQERRHEVLREQIENAPHVPFPDFTPISDYKKASPCSSSWEKMSGSGSMRFCETCQLMCYDFSSVEIEQARQIVYQREEKENCVLYKRKDGKFLSKDCPVGLKRKRSLVAAGAALASFAVVAIYFLSSLPAPEASISQSLKSESPSRDRLSPNASSQRIVMSPDGKQLRPNAGNTKLLNKDPDTLSGFVPADLPQAAESITTQASESPSFQGGVVPADLPLTPHIYAEKSESFAPASSGQELSK